MKQVSVPSQFDYIPGCNGLTSQEKIELEQCEAVIAKGWETFVEVGKALANIRDKKLYRTTHRTFEAYCRERWQYRKSYAYYLINAAQVVTYLSTIVDKKELLPSCEAQVRPLVGLDPTQIKEIWQEATNGGTSRNTEKDVRELAKKHRQQSSVYKPRKKADRKAQLKPNGNLSLAGLIDVLEEELNRKKLHREKLNDLCQQMKGLFHSESNGECGGSH